MLEWKTPPEPNRRSTPGKWMADALELRQHPGEWAVIAHGVKSTSLAQDVRTGKQQAFAPKGAFESRARSTGHHKWDIYARFVGQQQA